LRPIDNDEETLLSIAKQLASELKNLPSRSQLGWLRGMAEGGKAPLDILADIKNASTKQGGKAWKDFPLTDIKTAFESEFFRGNANRQRECLIALVRWLMPRIKETTETGAST